MDENPSKELSPEQPVARVPAGDGIPMPAAAETPPPKEGGRAGSSGTPSLHRKERLPIPAFHAWWVAAVFGLSLFLYLGTVCRGVFPGESALLTALHSGAAPLPALTHPLWGAVVRLLDRLPFATLSLRLSLFSAFCGAVAVALLFHLLAGFRTGLSSAASRRRRTVAGEEWIPRAPQRRGDSLLRHAPALIGAILLAGSFPLWFVSTRAHTGAFGLALVLSGAVLVAWYHRSGRGGVLLAAAVVGGLSLAETPTSIFLTPATALWALVAMAGHGALVLPFLTDGRRVERRIALPLAALGLTLLAAVVPILVRAAFLLGDPAAEWADVADYGAALVEVFRAMWIEIRALVPRLGWILLAVSVVLPAVLVGVSAFGERPGRRWLPLLTYGFASVFGVVIAFDVPFTPWSIFGLTPLYITPYAVVALWTAAAAAGVLRLWIRDLERTDLPVWFSQRDLSPMMRRRVAWGFSAALGAAVTVAAVRHVAPIRGASSDLFDSFAAGVLEEAAGCEWIVSASPFEHVLSVVARGRGERIRILDARMGRTPAYLRFVASSFAGDPRLRGITDAGVDAVLLDWFAQGTGLTERVAVLDLPDLWMISGYAAVPGRHVYRGVPKLDSGVLSERMAFLGAWTNRLAGMRRQVEALPPAIAPYGRWISVHAGRLLNDTGTLCEDAGRTEDALAAYGAAAAHDPDNYSVRRNRERLAREKGRPEADAFKEDLEAVVRRFGGRVDPAMMSRIHGRIRDPGAAMVRGIRAAAGGQTDVALAELMEAVRISDDPATRMALAAVMEGRGDIGGSREIVAGVSARDPSYVPADIVGTALALQAGDLAAAAAGIQRAAARPETAAASGFLSVLLEVAREDLKAASALVTRLQSERPDDPALLSMAAYVAWRRGDADALRIADQALTRRNIRIPLVSVLVAASEAAQGRRREARERLEETAARHPSYTPAWDALLRLDYIERRQDMAREHVARILRLRPDHPLANHFLASFQLDEGRLAEAEAALRVALRGAPEDPSILNDLAWCLIGQGRPADALPHARRAAELSRDSAEILDTLGLALMETGELQEASSVLTRAVGINPRNDAIRRHLEEVRIREAAAAATRRKTSGEPTN
jgi:tetratricopeptide (TPR) repeat protein